MSSTPNTAPDTSAADDNNAELITATYTLSIRRAQNPQLRRAEARARLRFAAAIIAMDEVDAHIQAGSATHSLIEQVAVEQAKDAYVQALVDLVRGQAGSCQN